MSLNYLVLGHLTRDLLADGGVAPGGTALYSALTAYRLGYGVGVVSAPAELPAYWPEDIVVKMTNSPTPPTFENRYTQGHRTQWIHTLSVPIQLDDIPEAWRDASIVHLGPILAEVDEAMTSAFPGALIGVTPQGWMRSWDATLPSLVHYKPWQPRAEILQHIDALVLSIEDVQGDTEIVKTYARSCPLVALTHGAGGATLFINGQEVHIPAQPATEQDPTGAGDVFAATLFCALRKGKPPVAAAEEAARIAAASVEAIGASGLLTLDVEP